MAKYVLEGKVFSPTDSRQNFSYSDGDEMENYILNFINQATDLSIGSEELALGIRDWPTLYHLSPKRADLLRPLAATLYGKTVLEIGSGCGAITRYLGELGCNVLALEGSERRAHITAARCRDLTNINVVCDNFEDFSWDEKFDVITLIGVLEYSNLFMKGVSPPLAMLDRIKKFLRPDGILIIAIENKLGLKYWAGAPEDHAGKAFFGIEDSYNARTAITFGKTELKDLLSTAGYTYSEFLYPFPDYKLPDVILKENAFETENFELLNLLYEKFEYDQGQPHTTSFFPALAVRPLLANQLLPDFSNSFLVISKLSPRGMIKDNKTLAYTYTSGRKKCYCKENVFVASPTKSIQVIKRKLYKNDCPPDQPIKLLLTNEQYFKGRLLSVDLLNIVSREDWTTGDLSVWAGTYYEILKSYAEQKSGSLFVPGKYLDLTPFNILIDSADKAVVFDQEWSCDEDVPLYFIFFRGIVYSLGKIFSFATPAEGTPDDLIELVITLINRIFPFDAADLQKCISLEEKYFSPVPLLPGKAFAYGKLKINAATGHLPEIIVQKEEVIARQKNEVEQKNKKITELESELRQNEQRQAKFAAQLEDQREELHRLSETFRFRLEALEKDVAWYRQTYEERSVVGVLKEKLGQGIRKQYRKIFGRLLNNRTVKGKYVLTYLLEYIRDEGLKNFFSLYADMIRSKGITALLHPRKAILSRMQPDAEAGLILSPGLPDPVPAIEKLKEEMQALRYRPKISLIFPTYNTKPSLLGMAISSIKDQVYDNWELCIVDDHSTRQETINLLHSHFDDARIKLKVLARNAGISEASNTAIKMATGDYIALMDHDDELTPDALLRIAQELNERGEADILYSDECKVDEQGNLSEYFFKPDWSPELLLNMMYPGHLTVYKKDFLLSEVGWFRKEYDFSQDYDLMLRATEKTTNIRHLKKILYHWRLTEGSASRGDKPHARRTNLAALAEAIKRRNVNADIIELPTANRVKLRFEAKPKVSIIIPTDSSRNLKEAIESITARTIYPDYELVVVTNSGLIKEMQKQFDLANLIYTAYDKPYNFSDKCNWGARHARGEIVIFFNDDVRPLEDDWIENTIEYLFVAGVGGVSPKLVYEDGTLQYAGMAVGVRGLIGTTLHGYPEDSVSYMNYPQLVRDVSILSGACLAMRKALFFEVGGFDAVNVPSAHSDVDLSFKIIEKGLHCVYTPYASLRHIGHLSLKEHEKKESPLKKDKADIFILKKWMKYLSEDAYFTLPMRDYLYHDSPEPFRLYPSLQSPAGMGTGEDILAVTHDLSLSGAPINLYDTCKMLAAKGHFVIVYSPVDGPLRQIYQEAGIAVIVDALLLRQHRSFYRFGRNFDHLLCNTVVTWPAVRQLKDTVPTIWWIQEGQALEQFTVDPDCEKTLHDAPTVIGLSEYALSYIRKYNPGAIKIYNACYDIRNKDTENRGSVSHQKIIFSIIGSLEERKGQDILLDAISLVEDPLLQNAEFRLIGRFQNPAFVKKLEQKVLYLEQMTGHHDLVRIMGEFNHDQCLELIRDSDVIINTSRDEPLSVVLVEAFCLGKPCIVSEKTGIAELMRDEADGYIFRHEDETDLAEKIRSILKGDPERLTAIGMQARAIYEEYFSMKQFEKKILALLAERKMPESRHVTIGPSSGISQKALPPFIKTDEFTGVENTCRREKVAHFYLSGKGLEIGALHRPLAIDREKASISYVDYKSRKENRARYPELVDEFIVNTDIIDDGFLLESIPQSSQDFIIANHALEHSPDPLGTLEVWLEKLKASGIIYVTVPIAAKCYDKGRPITTLQHLEEDHRHFAGLDKEAILMSVKSHIQEFITISGRNIARMNNSMISPAQEQELYQHLVGGLTEKVDEATSYEELVNAHVTKLNRVYDIHYHTFSPSSYEAFLRYFCMENEATLEDVVKNASGECIGIIRKNTQKAIYLHHYLTKSTSHCIQEREQARSS